jgi:cation diffusion facilitator CzcD-associated flavoprotein CzcO
VYASSQQIFEYFESFARKYHLHDFVKTEHQVSGAFWNKQSNGYDVKVQDLKTGTEITDHCDILVNASGILNNWRWPAIPGLKDFKGTLLHTASWDEKVALDGKHVGLIGNGYVHPVSRGDVVLTFVALPAFKSYRLSNRRFPT